MIGELKTMYHKVAALLMAFPHLRDCDSKLIATIWNSEIKAMGKSSAVMYGIDLLQLIAEGKLTSSDVITRARRKVQELDPLLRGTKWITRHEKAAKVSKEICKV